LKEVFKEGHGVNGEEQHKRQPWGNINSSKKKAGHVPGGKGELWRGATKGNKIPVVKKHMLSRGGG